MATPINLPRPSTLPALYRLLLRTSRSTFAGDTKMIAAWRTYVRQKLPAQAQQQAQGSSSAQQALSDELVAEWLDVVRMLRMNVVQGVKEKEDEAYREWQ